ncbi:MAG: transcription antitermination factor NusB [Gemmataceae bacterium]
MFRRSRAREVALQLLFQFDQNKKPMSDKAVRRFAADRLPTDPDGVAFCLELFAGVNAHRGAIDAAISAAAENWKIGRMLPTDRNLLRLGTYELLHAPAPPPVPVVLNEVVEMARRFGTADSPAFVNGVLDRIAKTRGAEVGTRSEEKPPAEPAAPSPEPPPADSSAVPSS